MRTLATHRLAVAVLIFALSVGYMGLALYSSTAALVAGVGYVAVVLTLELALELGRHQRDVR